MKVTKLPSYHLVEANEGRMLFYRLEKGLSKRAAAVKANASYRSWSKTGILRCVDEWAAGEHLIVLEALAQAKEAETRQPPPEDPAMHALLKEIEQRGQTVKMTPLNPTPIGGSTVPKMAETALGRIDPSQSTPPELSPVSNAPSPFQPANDSPRAREARTAAAIAKLEAEAAAKMAEPPLTQAELVAKMYPPQFDVPVSLA